jgi:hypothetical protein
MTAQIQDIKRSITLRTRVAEGYHLTDLQLKHLQHVFTVWFPAVVFKDLTQDTARVDVVVRKGHLSRQSVYQASFVRADGSVIKTTAYDEDRITGKVCPYYDLRRGEYLGKQDGFDCRSLFYRTMPKSKTRH